MKPDASLLRCLVKLHNEVGDTWSTEIRHRGGFNQPTVIFSAMTTEGAQAIADAFGLELGWVSSISGKHEWLHAEGLHEGITVRVDGPHRLKAEVVQS
jgi:hypothetical protein